MNMRTLILTVLCTVALAVSISQGFTAEQNVGAAPSDQADSAVVVADKIDINQAGPVELTKLPGIGTSTAAKISAYRDVNGPFKSLDELLNVKGIGPEKLEKIKPLVTLS
ncbi:MAG: ComEA family DNA-binding protein [Desulfocapsaceae bacterium]